MCQIQHQLCFKIVTETAIFRFHVIASLKHYILFSVCFDFNRSPVIAHSNFLYIRFLTSARLAFSSIAQVTINKTVNVFTAISSRTVSIVIITKEYVKNGSFNRFDKRHGDKNDITNLCVTQLTQGLS